MFNFQKEVVLNSLDKADVVNPGGDGKAGTLNIDKKVRFLGGGEYFTKYIVDGKIYQTDPITGTNFELVLHAPAAILGQHIQILIELGLDSDYRGDYGSAVWYFRKPILVDVVLPNDNAAAVKVIYKAITTAIPDEYKFIEVSYVDGADSLTIKGSDSYQKVRKVVIGRYECDDRCAGSSEELIEVVNASAGALESGNDYVTYTPNNVEFGTYDYVLHNLRLPTYANLRFTSPSAVEMPVQGVNYTQFSFAYCVPRVGFGGVSVAGQTNHSTTLHTFFVAANLVDKFKKLFTDAGLADGDFVQLGRRGNHEVTILPDSYASSQDLKAANDIKANSEADAEVKEQVTKNKAAIKANHSEADV